MVRCLRVRAWLGLSRARRVALAILLFSRDRLSPPPRAHGSQTVAGAPHQVQVEPGHSDARRW